MFIANNFCELFFFVGSRKLFFLKYDVDDGNPFSLFSTFFWIHAVLTGTVMSLILFHRNVETMLRVIIFNSLLIVVNHEDQNEIKSLFSFSSLAYFYHHNFVIYLTLRLCQLSGENRSRSRDEHSLTEVVLQRRFTYLREHGLWGETLPSLSLRRTFGDFQVSTRFNNQRKENFPKHLCLNFAAFPLISFIAFSFPRNKKTKAKNKTPWMEIDFALFSLL